MPEFSGDASNSSFPGPHELGRGAVIAAGQATPELLARASRFVVDAAVLANPQPTADAMHRAWLGRKPMVVELAVPAETLRQRETIETPIHSLAATTHLHRERVQFLTWANNYDMRSGQPVWWHGVIASRRVAGTQPSERADVRCGGRDVWIDGGPRGMVDGIDAAVMHRESLSVTNRADPPPLVQPRGPAHLKPAAGFTHLAEDQLLAATHEVGAARLIAPAGSGKTRVLTARIRYLTEHCGVEPEVITAVAYNTRAARQLQDRLGRENAGLSRLSIRTIHSLAYAICSTERPRNVVDERQIRAILQQLLRVPRIPNQDPFQPYLDALSDVRIGLRTPNEVEATRGDVDGFTELFDTYRHVLDDRDALDFDEQIYHAIELLLTRPDIRDDVQRQATHLLVDEFQDLTPAYLLLLRLIAGPSMQVFAVGDDDQTIYGYSGASPSYLVDFDRLFPGSRMLALHTNYRCPPSIVSAATNLLSHNEIRVEKRIRSGPKHGLQPQPGIELTVHRTARDASAGLIAYRITEMLSQGTEPHNIAILARVNSALLAVQVALTQAGVPHSAPLNPQVLRRTGIRTALAYMRIACEPSAIGRESVLDTINRPVRKVRSVVAPLLPRSTMSLARLRRLERQLHEDQRQRFNDYLDDLDLLVGAVRAGATTRVLLAQIRNDVGVDIAMDALDASRSRPEGSSHTDDLDALEQIAHLCPDPAGFGSWLASQLGRSESEASAVMLSTIHRVKGMEWPHVFLAGANAGLIPHRLADDLEEERRILHVAITRSAGTLDIVADESRPSPLLAELTRRRPAGEPATTAPKPRTASANAPTADAASLFDALRDWRSALARMAGSPAFVIFHDRALRDIADRQPTTLADLAACNGVGPAKLERFGDDLLAIIEQHQLGRDRSEHG